MQKRLLFFENERVEIDARHAEEIQNPSLMRVYHGIMEIGLRVIEEGGLRKQPGFNEAQFIDDLQRSYSNLNFKNGQRLLLEGSQEVRKQVLELSNLNLWRRNFNYRKVAPKCAKGF